MRRPLLPAIALTILVASPFAAGAFTMEGGDGAKVPKFDVEEQARNFRSRDLGSAFDNKRDFSTPWGTGTLNFGVQQNGSLYGSGFRGADDRRHMDRMLAPPSLQHQFER